MSSFLAHKVSSPSHKLRSAVRAAVEPLEARQLFAVTTFEIDPSLSFVSLSARALGENLDSQSSGSLRAAYEGQIEVDLDADTIEFLSENTEIIAQSKGNFDPGDAPANYAGEAEGPFGIKLGEAAVRGLKLTVSSNPLALTSTGEGAFRFSSSGEQVAVTDGVLEYDILGSDGDEDLDGNSVDNDGAAATVVTVDGVTTLTLPVKVTYEYGGIARLRLSGKIVATSTGTKPFVDVNGPDATGSAFTDRLNVQTTDSIAAVAPDLRVRDDGDTIVAATIAITNLADGANESLSVDNSASGIGTSYDVTTSTLTLTGSATKEAYQTVLRTLTYTNNAADPTTGNRVISIVLDDGTELGTAGTSTIEVWDPNVVTIGAGSNSSVKYTEADGSVTTIRLTGGGAATVTFAGGTAQTIVRNVATVAGTNVTLSDITIVDGTKGGVVVDGSAAKSTLSISTTRGDAVTSIDSITAAEGLKNLSAKSADVTGAIDIAGALIAGSIRSLTGGSITANSIRTLSVNGAFTNSTLTITDPADPFLVPSLRTLTIKGAVTGSTFEVPGTIGTFRAYSLTDSGVYAGRVGADTFANDLADMAADGAILSLSLRTPGAVAGTPVFSNSVVQARKIKTISLGVVDTDNGVDLFGVAADVITSLKATDLLGTKLSVSKLDETVAANVELAEDGFSFDDFEVRVF